jgi:CubicO group peptidase (beta-lactamase class C family)
MSKSVVSLLIGCAIDDKLINSGKDPVTEYIPEFKESGFKNITIADLLNMKAPVNYTESDNPLGKHAWFYYSSTLEKDILDLTADEEGEKEFVYRSANSAILGLVLKRILKTETITQYTQRKIWTPLGMESNGLWNIDHNPGGLEKVWCCLSGTAKDFARIGLLYNRLGKWNNRQIVSKEWIEETIKPLPGAKDELSYSLGWWMLPAKNAVIAIGKDGQYTYVCPGKNLVIVRIGEKEGDIGREGWLKLFGEISDCY